MKISLNGDWRFREAGGEWKPAKVPGCNYLDLISSGAIDDPFYGLNEKKASRVGDEDWIYAKEFEFAPDPADFGEVTLSAERLDTVCVLFINGREIGRADNCFIPHEFDIKHAVIRGSNTLEIHFRSPIGYVRENAVRLSAPRNNNGLNGIVTIRKPQYHFGWDWGPMLPPAGVGGPICVNAVESGKIIDFIVRQTRTEEGFAVKAAASFAIFGGSAEWEISMTHPDGRREFAAGAGSRAECGFTVKNPELWWTYEMSGRETQPLYTLTAVLSAGGWEAARAEKKIGLRTLELDTGADGYGRNFRFILNGVPLFIKGANLIPPDSFVERFDGDKLAKLIKAARFGNFNLIRVWGGGYYGSEELYDECDRLGILVWQDFMFACQAYPFFDGEFARNVEREISFQVARLSHRPSLAVWCGNNEVESMAINWFWKRRYVRWTEKFFYGILPKIIRKTDENTPYIPGSPCGEGYNRGIASDNVGDTHIWAVWQGLQPLNYYRKRMTRFCSEFGFESLPERRTLRSFAEESDFSLDSEVFAAHQKSRGGNGKLVYYIASRFRLPEKFDDYIYLSQLFQAECLRDATEHWRRHRGRCNGSVYWQFNDCWPTCSWSGMDYFLRYKAAAYYARRFFSPVAVSIEDGEGFKVYAVNDGRESVSAEVRFRTFHFDGREGFCEIKSAVLPPCSSTLIAAYSAEALGIKGERNGCAAAELFTGGTRIGKSVSLFAAEKRLSLPDPKISVRTEVRDGEAEITLKAESFARAVRLTSASDEPFGDNWFDMLPGEEIVVRQNIGSADAADYEKSVNAYSLYDVKSAGSLASDARERIKVLLRPVNLICRIFTSSVPKDARITEKEEE